MRDYFVIDGKSSVDFNTFLATSTLWNGAERDVEQIEIPGRDGALNLDNGRYRNFVATLTAYVPSRMREFVPALRDFLASRRGYCRYEDSIRPEEYRMARFAGEFVISESDRMGAAIELTFDCKPQRYLKTGEQVTEVTTSSRVIYNPTEQEAKPLIRVYGYGTIVIGGTSVTVGSHQLSYIDIDCELMDCYSGATNCNSLVTLVNGEFPKLVPGPVTITKAGTVTKLEITPRWWRV